MKNQEIKTVIEVSGAILTPECLNQIYTLQEHDNEMIDMCQKYISEAVCQLAISIDHTDPESAAKSQRILIDLSYVKNYFNDFRKP